MNANAVVNIVDDDAAARHSLGMLMQSVGLNAKSYASAREFLDEFDASNPGCMMIDVRMADMGGLELQTELMLLPNTLPVMMKCMQIQKVILTRLLKLIYLNWNRISMGLLHPIWHGLFLNLPMQLK